MIKSFETFLSIITIIFIIFVVYCTIKQYHGLFKILIPIGIGLLINWIIFHIIKLIWNINKQKIRSDYEIPD